MMMKGRKSNLENNGVVGLFKFALSRVFPCLQDEIYIWESKTANEVARTTK